MKFSKFSKKNKTKFLEGDIIAPDYDLSDEWIVTSIVGFLYFIKRVSGTAKAHRDAYLIDSSCVFIRREKKKQIMRW